MLFENRTLLFTNPLAAIVPATSNRRHGGEHQRSSVTGSTSGWRTGGCTGSITLRSTPLLELARPPDLVGTVERAAHDHDRTTNLVVWPGETSGSWASPAAGKSLTRQSDHPAAPRRACPRGGSIRYRRTRGDGRCARSEIERSAAASISLIFQDPFTMLNPLLRCGEHIDEMLVDSAKTSPVAIERRRDETVRRLAEVGIPDPHVADRYPFQLSGGCGSESALAAALRSDPGVLIADEPSTALDVTTQAEILDAAQRGSAGPRDGSDPDHARPPRRLHDIATACTSCTPARSSS